MSNRTSGTRFEHEFAEFLSKHGFWVHVMQQNKSGQPADIIAVKGDYHCLIDCKEVSTRAGFVLDRVEENQRLAMTMFQNRGGQIGWFAVKYPDGVVRMISLIAVTMAEKLGVKAISGMLAEQFMTAEEWVYRSALHMQSLYQKKLQDQSEVISDVLKRVLKIPRMPKAAREILNQIACDDDDDELDEW